MKVRVPIRGSIISNAFSANSHLNNLIGTATWFIQLLYSIIMVVSVVALIINITKLAMSAGNPQARSEAIRNILIAGGCLAVLGGLGLIFLLVVTII